MLADQAHLRRPKVRAIADPDGNTIEPFDIDVLEDEGTDIVTVRRAMLAKSVA